MRFQDCVSDLHPMRHCYRTV